MSKDSKTSDFPTSSAILRSLARKNASASSSVDPTGGLPWRVTSSVLRFGSRLWIATFVENVTSVTNRRPRMANRSRTGWRIEPLEPSAASQLGEEGTS